MQKSRKPSSSCVNSSKTKDGRGDSWGDDVLGFLAAKHNLHVEETGYHVDCYVAFVNDSLSFQFPIPPIHSLSNTQLLLFISIN